jgi:hypothetical protein
MRKRRLAALAAVLLLLASCGRAEKGAVPQDAYPETDAAPGVTVSRFKTFGLVNGAVYGSSKNRKRSGRSKTPSIRRNACRAS